VRAVDNDTWRESRNSDTQSLIAIQTLTAVEPGKETLARLKEYYAIPYQW